MMNIEGIIAKENYIKLGEKHIITNLLYTDKSILADNICKANQKFHLFINKWNDTYLFFD